MNAEFNVWMLIVGLIVGAGLVWLVVMDTRRDEADVDATERPREAAWISMVMAEDGVELTPETAERLLALHRAYIGAPPPDPPGVEDEAIEPAVYAPAVDEAPIREEPEGSPDEKPPPERVDPVER